MTRYFIDTNVFIWWMRGSTRLSTTAFRVLTDERSVILGSVVAPWELASKAATGGLPDGDALIALFVTQAEAGVIDVVAPDLRDIAVLRSLPLIHRDPFDRMLIAQAIARSVPLVSSDDSLRAYGVPVVW